MVNIPKDTEEHSTEHRFRRLNTLTVNEHNWKWNSSSSTSFIDSHWYIPFLLSPTGKIAVFFAKRSSSSYKQKFTKFSREKALSQFHFSIFKIPLQSASFSPQTYDLSVSQTLRILIFCLYAIMNHQGDWSVSGIYAFIVSAFDFLLPLISSKIPLASVILLPKGSVFSMPQ